MTHVSWTMGPIGHTILGGFVTWLYACMIQKKLKNSQGILNFLVYICGQIENSLQKIIT